MIRRSRVRSLQEQSMDMETRCRISGQRRRRHLKGQTTATTTSSTPSTTTRAMEQPEEPGRNYKRAKINLVDGTTLTKIPRVTTSQGKTVEVAVNEEDLALPEPILLVLKYSDKDKVLEPDKLRAGMDKEMTAMKEF